jgi:hypothetical protein
MSDLATYIELGFRHITDLKGADHILFLLALAAIYRFRDWRECLWVATAFTVGHSLTLALAVTNVLNLRPALVEFLIPITIVATGLENLFARDRAKTPGIRRYRPVLAGVFGLVHGAGFANYLRSLFVEDIALPLFGFNVGIELGQICVLLSDVHRVHGRRPADRDAPAVGRWTSGTSADPRRRGIVDRALIAARWAVERAPW